MPKPALRPNGSRRRPDEGWEAFTEKVLEAARKKRRKPQQSAAQLANLRPMPMPIVYKRQCVAIAGMTGARCRKGAAPGAERCHKHGGILEAPGHPTTIRLVTEGRIAGHREARRAFYAYDRQTRTTVDAALAAGGAPRNIKLRLQGAQALNADDGGLAWRRWCKEISRR